MSVLLVLVCIGLYTGQNFFNRMYSGRYPGDPAAATSVFSLIYGLLTSLITVVMSGFSVHPTPAIWAIGAANGLVLFFYNMGMIQAARRGPFAFQSIIMLFGNILVPMLFSVFLWGDRLSILQFIGIGMMLVSFVLLNGDNLTFAGAKKGYYFFVISLFFTNGLYSELLDVQKRLYPDQRNEMIIATFLSSAAVSALYLLLSRKKRELPAFQMGKKPWLFAMTSSACAGFAVFLLMYLLQIIPSYILYTVISGSILLVSVLLSVLVLKEKISRGMTIGIVFAVGSIIALSL